MHGGSAVTKITSGELVGGPRAQRGDQGRSDIGRQRQPSLPSSFAGYTHSPVVPVDVLHLVRCGLFCSEAEPAQQQQDGAVPPAVGARIVHRGQYPLHVVIGEGPGQCGVLPFPDGRYGALNAGGTHTTSGQEAEERTGGCSRGTRGRVTKFAGPGLHERCDRRHGEPGPVGRRRPRAIGKKGCGIAAVRPPGPDNQAMCLHEMIVEALQPLLGLAWRGDRDRVRRYPSGP